MRQAAILSVLSRVSLPRSQHDDSRLFTFVVHIYPSSRVLCCRPPRATPKPPTRTRKSPLLFLLKSEPHAPENTCACTRKLRLPEHVRRLDGSSIRSSRVYSLPVPALRLARTSFFLVPFTRFLRVVHNSLLWSPSLSQGVKVYLRLK